MKDFVLPIAGILAMAAMIILSLAPVVSADEYAQAASQTWDDKGMDNMPMGKHSMPATIETIDHKTGFMKLKSGMGEMTIHFPAPTVKDLEKGDKITVNLSYTKEDEKMKK